MGQNVWKRPRNRYRVNYQKRGERYEEVKCDKEDAEQLIQIKNFELKKRRKQLQRTRIALAIVVAICAILMISLILVLLPPKSSSGDGKISPEEKELLAKLVWVEAGTESFECQVAIAAVVLNRYNSDIPYFDTESITSVIRQKYQFAPVDDIDFVNRTAMEAVEAAINGWDPTREAFPEGALYFYAPKLMPDDFQKGVEVYRIDDVNFYRDYKLPEAQG